MSRRGRAPKGEQVIRWRVRAYKQYLAQSGSIVREQLKRFLKGKRIDSWDYVFHPSPNGQVLVSAFDCVEYKMGWYAWRLGVHEPGGNLIQTYPELFSHDPRIFAWSKKGERFCILADRIDLGLFIHDLPHDQYSAIAFPQEPSYALPDIVPRWESETKLRVELHERRLGNWSGKKPPPHPVRRFKKPKPVRIHLTQLEWRPLSRLNDYDDLLKNNPCYKVDRIANGFDEYHGKYPLSTRGLGVCALRLFAEYGDKQCRIWLEELENKAGSKLNSEKVSDHIGIQRRAIPPPK